MALNFFKQKEQGKCQNPECGASAPATAKFCSKCGAKAAPPVESEEQSAGERQPEVDSAPAAKKGARREQLLRKKAKQDPAFKIDAGKNLQGGKVKREDFSDLSAIANLRGATRMTVDGSVGYAEQNYTDNSVHSHQGAAKFPAARSGGPRVAIGGDAGAVEVNHTDNSTHTYNYHRQYVHKKNIVHHTVIQGGRFRYCCEGPLRDGDGILPSWFVKRRDNNKLYVAKLFPVEHTNLGRFAQQVRNIATPVVQLTNYVTFERAADVETPAGRAAGGGIVLIREATGEKMVNLNVISEKQGRMPSEEVAELIEQVARVIHLRKYAHGGIKPENIFVDPDDRSKLEITDYRLRDLKTIAAKMNPDFAAVWQAYEGEDLFLGGMEHIPAKQRDVVSLGNLLLFMVLGLKTFVKYRQGKGLVDYPADTDFTLLDVGDRAAQGRIKDLGELQRCLAETSSLAKSSKVGRLELDISGLLT